MVRLRPVSWFLVPLLGAFLATKTALAQDGQPQRLPTGERSSRILVIGFVGGFVRHDEPRHPEVLLIQHLREKYPARVEGRVFENHRCRDAYRLIREKLDTNHDGKLSAEEKLNARILLFGHSWGASTVVSLARHLERDGIPVALTVQIDSVAKVGENDSLIPPNVREAVNFYQRGGWLHGRKRIKAVDPTRTQILGNYQFSYQNRSVDCSGSPWYGRAFTKGHIQIERDPELWSQIESLIRAQLPKEVSTGSPRDGLEPVRPADADVR